MIGLFLSIVSLTLGASLACPTTKGAWQNLAASDVSQLPPLCFANATSADISQLGLYNDACSGLTEAQFQAINAPACSGFTTSCSDSWTATSLTGLQASCVGQLKSRIFGDITGDQLAALQAPACGAITGPQAAALGSTASPCTKLSSTCLAAFSTAAIASLNGINCVGDVPGASLASLSAKQFGSFSSNAIAQLTSTQMSALNSEQCSGFTASQMAKLGQSSSPCTAMSPNCLGAILPAAINGMSGVNCLGDLPPATIKALSSAQVAALSKSAVAAINKNQFAEFGANCIGFGSAASSLGQSQSPCLSMTETCFQSFSVVALQALSGINCLSDIPCQSFSGINGTQLGSLSPSAIAGLTAKQMPCIGSACAGYDYCFKNDTNN